MQDRGPYITGLRQFTAPGYYFSAAEEPRWIIVTPTAPATVAGPYEYGPEIRAMKHTLRNLFPNAPPVVVGYIPQPDRRAQTRTAAGKIIVQYDSLQTFIPNSTNARSHREAIIRVWVEDRPHPVFEKQWSARSTQVVPDSSLKSRNGKRGRVATEIPRLPK